MKKSSKSSLIFITFLITIPIFLSSMDIPDTFAYSTTSVSQATYVPAVETPPLNKIEKLPSSLYSTAQSSTDTYVASTGFSSQQGLNQWYYQQWNGSSYSNMTWDSTYGRWKGTPAYTLVMSNGQHPDAQDSVRKWLSPKAGIIHITGVVKKGDISYGDGVLVKVMKNQEQLWPASGWQSIQYNDSTGYELNVTTSVSSGDSIYFIVNKNVTTYADTTAWDPVITYVNNSTTYSYEYNARAD
ncbi:hypothetical protein [Paenibacillus sp. S150]|uniref:hypothetical protein n=1 Tax=Paenibacillus sp. S150 TaxID=2749826 RepID=UPI001C59A39B|nr:hypothetical protein [Paenibacillus sp. S150]MBW4081740.1 hypothetical protein [Paenibacillus sp. S150]